jgi:hypothetical protein
LCDGTDNQDVGLEAAIIERKRNSSLVESSCADNVAGLKYTAETAGLTAMLIGRRAFLSAVKVDREDGWSGRK